MAPFSIETATVAVPEVNSAKLQFVHHRGFHGKLALVVFDKEAELSDNESFQTARLQLIKPGRWQRCTPFCCSLEPTLTYSSSAASPSYPYLKPRAKVSPVEAFRALRERQGCRHLKEKSRPEDTTVTHPTPIFGTEVRGNQLSTLTSTGKDELARLVMVRKVVAFCGLDFADLLVEEALKLGLGNFLITFNSGKCCN